MDESHRDDIDEKFRRLFDELSEIKAVVRQLNGVEGVDKLTRITRKLDDLEFKMDHLDTKMAFAIVTIVGAVSITHKVTLSWWDLSLHVGTMVAGFYLLSPFRYKKP